MFLRGFHVLATLKRSKLKQAHDIVTMRWICAAVACLASTALSVFVDEANQIDYHQALLGLPLRESTFFHQPFAGSKASLIYTLTEEGVLGAVNPKDGSIVWRQKIISKDDDPSTRRVLKAGENQDTVVCASGSSVSAWSSTDGRSAWRQRFAGNVVDLEVLEMPTSDSAAGKDAIVLVHTSNGIVAQRLDSNAGSAKWTYADERYVHGFENS